MSKNIPFIKGDFITQISNTESIAVFEGKTFKHNEGPTEYTLNCYYNPNHFEKNSDGCWYSEKIFEYDMTDDSMVCEYTISEDDFPYWRNCTQEEINKFLKLIADEYHIAYEKSKYKFRKLYQNETIKFDDELPKSTGQPGGTVVYHNQRYSNPYHNGNSTHIIRMTVDKDWQQKEPISSMTFEHSQMVLNECDKLKYSFDNYGTYYTTTQPTVGYSMNSHIRPIYDYPY